MKINSRALVYLLTLTAAFIFIFSCVITLSDGQGALIFVFSIPAMVVLLFFAILISHRIKKEKDSVSYVDIAPKFLSCFLVVFFVSAFIPGLRIMPDTFMGFIGNVFALTTGKTPYAFFKDRASFPNKLEDALKRQTKINFSNLDLTFAWDKVCVFGPYTNNVKARQVLNLDWNIEERSQIYFSDSINALVFLYQGKVNQVVDLKRGIADFKNVDICLSSAQANFEAEVDLNGRKFLKLVK